MKKLIPRTCLHWLKKIKSKSTLGVLHWDACQLLFTREISLTGSCVGTLGAQRVVLLERWWNLQQVKPRWGKGVTEGKQVCSPAPLSTPISLSFLVYQAVNKTPHVPATVKDHPSPARKNNNGTPYNCEPKQTSFLLGIWSQWQER